MSSDNSDMSIDSSNDLTSSEITPDVLGSVNIENVENPQVKLVEQLELESLDSETEVPLPEGWNVITHESGIPVYYHQATLVATLSRPFSYESPLRFFDPPTTAIPCLHWRRMEEKRKKAQNGAAKKDSKPDVPCKIEETLTTTELHSYCQKLFRFETKFEKAFVATAPNIIDPESQEPVAKKARKLLTEEMVNDEYYGVKSRNMNRMMLVFSNREVRLDLTLSLLDKKYLMNPMGKTATQIVAELAERVFHGMIENKIEDLEEEGFVAVLRLIIPFSRFTQLSNNEKQEMTTFWNISTLRERSSVGTNEETMTYEVCTGFGESIELAERAAAREMITMIFPHMRMNKKDVCVGVYEEHFITEVRDNIRNHFQWISIGSPDVFPLCNKFSILSPFNILTLALRKLRKWSGMELKCEQGFISTGIFVVQLTLGSYIRRGTGNSRMVAKEIAAQQLLMILHPRFNTYGSFLSVYDELDYSKFKDIIARQCPENVNADLRVKNPDLSNLCNSKKQKLLNNNRSSRKRSHESVDKEPEQSTTKECKVIYNTAILEALKKALGKA